jgi:hypothetical protein
MECDKWRQQNKIGEGIMGCDSDKFPTNLYRNEENVVVILGCDLRRKYDIL